MDELAKRVRAARAYAGLTQEDLANRLGMAGVTYKRLEQGKRTVTLDEVRRVSEITQMPEVFFSIDLSQLTDNAVPRARLEEAGERIQDLVGRLEDIEYRMRQNQPSRRTPS